MQILFSGFTLGAFRFEYKDKIEDELEHHFKCSLRMLDSHLSHQSFSRVSLSAVNNGKKRDSLRTWLVKNLKVVLLLNLELILRSEVLYCKCNLLGKVVLTDFISSMVQLFPICHSCDLYHWLFSNITRRIQILIAVGFEGLKVDDKWHINYKLTAHRLHEFVHQ